MQEEQPQQQPQSQQQPQQIDQQEVQHQSKDEKRMERQRARSMRTFRNTLIVGVIIIAAGYGMYRLLQSAAPQGEDFSRAVSLMNANHVAIGSQLPVYTSNPPTSGPHYGQTARSGFREEEIPDQHVIHNLEHGDIWIAYHPRISDEVREELTQFAAAKVIVTPREANDHDIALAAWGRLDAFDVQGGTVPVERIADFITRYSNRGPEKVFGASGGI